MHLDDAHASDTSDAHANGDRPPHRLRLPGFVDDEEIGLGDAVKRVSYALGISPCSGCQRRAMTLNRWIVLSR
jgi:hypothetical protein